MNDVTNEGVAVAEVTVPAVVSPADVAAEVAKEAAKQDKEVPAEVKAE